VFKVLLLNIVILLSAKIFCQAADKNIDINVKCNNRPLYEVLEYIRMNNEINFIYNDGAIDSLKVTCDINNLSLQKALDKLFRNVDLSYKIFDKTNYVIYNKSKPVPFKKYKAVIVKENVTETNTAVDIIKPKIISNIKPVYPYEAIKNRIEGNVGVKLFITAEGDISRALVTKSSGSAILDSAAIDYVRKLKFIPAQVNGKDQNIWMNMLFKYYIENQFEEIHK